MFKKPLVILGILGALLIIAGLIFNPSFLVKFAPSGKFRSGWTVAEINLVQSYFIIFGIVLVLGSLIISRLPKEKRGSQYLLGICFVGIVITIAGIVFNPSFVEKNFSPINFLEDHNIVSLKYLQLATITLGSLIILISLLIYRKKYLNPQKKYGWIISISVLILYLILIDCTYIKLQYPSNIIARPAEYGKVIDLLLGRDIVLSDFDPQSTLVVKRKQITKAKYPVIDINVHLSSSFQTEYDRKVLTPENLIKSMDSVGVKLIINTDGNYGKLEEVLNRYARKYPDRFINFWPTWFPPVIMTDEQLASLPDELDRVVKMGATGEGELWKDFGIRTRDATGKVIPVDDPRIDPLWAKAGELGIPILWHMGDPAPMFQPVNRFNERYIELRRYSEWSFYGPRFPSRETILKGRENVFRKHPGTIFIGCHMGWSSDNLDYAAYLLDTYPNYYLDISTTLSELGRQPYTARKFFIKYQDRILFGTDGGSLFGVKGWSVEKFYQAYFEFLETDNEYIDYPMQGAINQGSWKIYGIYLPDEVLEKLYYKNAEKILKVKIQ